MTFLCASEFEASRDSGAAGSILAIGEALERRGHRVRYAWKGEEPSRFAHPRLEQILEQPWRQSRRVAAALARAEAEASVDVVVISQPYAFPAFERLPRRHPRTLFLNRTHGWEGRLHEAALRHGFHHAEGPVGRLLSGAAARVTRYYGGRTLRAAHGLVAPTRLCGDYVQRHHRLPDDKLAILPYGLDADYRETPERPPRDPEAPPRLLYVGNYLVLKGSRLLESLLPDVARRHPETRLRFVVPPESVEAVEAAFRPAFGERLTVTPWLPRAELRQVYLEHDVFLYPTLFEGFGKTFLEAMACGLCVVGSSQGGLPDLATDGEEALHGPPGDREAFEERLESCLNDPVRAARIGARAQKRVRDLSWDRHAAGLEGFCLERRRALGLDRSHRPDPDANTPAPRSRR